MKKVWKGALIWGVIGGIIGVVYLFYNLLICRVACSSIINRLSEFYIFLPFVIPLITFLVGYLVGLLFKRDKCIFSVFLFVSLIFVFNTSLILAYEENTTANLILNFSSNKISPTQYMDKDIIRDFASSESIKENDERLDILNDSDKVIFTTSIPPSDELINLSLSPGDYKIVKIDGKETAEDNITIKEGEQIIVPMYSPAVEGYIIDAPSYIISSQTNLPLLTIADDEAELYPDLNNIWVYDANNGDSLVTYTGWAGSKVIDSTNTPFFYLFNINKNSFSKSNGKIKIKVLFELSAWWLPNNWEGPIEVEIWNKDLVKINEWYCGDAHYHSSYTNTKSTQWIFAELGAPINATTKSLDALGLDWVTITDHSNSFNIPANNFSNFKNECNGNNKCLIGEEVNCRTKTSGNLLGNSLPGNHYLAYNLDSPFLDDGRNNVPYCDERVNFINSVGKFGYVAHPESTLDVLGIADIISKWENYSLPFTGLEIWNREISDDLDAGLGKWKELILSGRKIFISAGSDAHGDLNTYFGKEYTCVYALYYSKSNIFNGLKNGNSFISNNGALTLKISYGNKTAILGETIKVPKTKTAKIDMNYNVEESCDLKLYKGIIGESEESWVGWGLVSNSETKTYYDIYNKNVYYRLECLNSDGSKRIYTNPIWVEQACSYPNVIDCNSEAEVDQIEEEWQQGICTRDEMNSCLTNYLSSSCITPTNGMIINQNTIFCRGNYSLPDGIKINADNIILDCNGTNIIGNTDGKTYVVDSIGVSTVNAQNISIKNCNIMNYTKGIYSSTSIYKINRIINNTIINNFRGIESIGPHEIIFNNVNSNFQTGIDVQPYSIGGEPVLFFNISINNIFGNLYGLRNGGEANLNVYAINNWWGTTNETEIRNKISGNVTFIPYLYKPTNEPIDTSPPEMTILSPTDNSWYNDNFLWLNLTTNKNATCIYSKGSCSSWLQSCKEGEPCAGAGSCGGGPPGQNMSLTGTTFHSQLITNLSDTKRYTNVNGTYEEWNVLYINCTDGFGNSNRTSIKFYVDTKSPVIHDQFPTNGTKVYGTTQFNVTYSEENLLSVKLRLGKNLSYYYGVPPSNGSSGGGGGGGILSSFIKMLENVVPPSNGSGGGGGGGGAAYRIYTLNCTSGINQTCYYNLNLSSIFDEGKIEYQFLIEDVASNVVSGYIPTLEIDSCIPNWTEIKKCQQDDSLLSWFNDTNSCYKKTNLSSDLIGKPNNTTSLLFCDFDKDGFIGSIGDINTTLSNLILFGDGNSVSIAEGNGTIIEFEFNFTEDSINLGRLFIEKQSNESNFAYMLISGLDLTSQNQTKTVFLDKLTSSTGVCIKDEEITSIIEITAGCDGNNEIWIKCPGSKGQYSCELNVTLNKYKVSGLKHSGVKEQSTYCGDRIVNGGETCSSCPVDVGACPPVLYCGDGICNNGESCSSCSTDCGSCSSGGGGGGGGGGGAITPKINTTTTTPKTTSKQTTTPQTPTTNKTTEPIINETIEGKPAGITGAVIGIAKNKVFWAIAFIVIIVGVAIGVYQFKIKRKIKTI